MAILYEIKQGLESSNTTGSTSLAATTALTLTLLFAQYSSPSILLDSNQPKMRRTEGTITEPLSFRVSDLDLFSQINKVYDDLLASQVDLDASSKRALYENLWDLYT